MKHLTLRRLNAFLTLVAVGLAVYILAAPFWPKATFQWKDTPPLASSTQTERIPDQNTLMIPKMKLQETIHDGATKAALNRGVWHPSKTGNPGIGGNMVLTGHRFTYAGPAVFYHMDMLAVGDEITIYWEKQKYDYKVEQIEVVSPSNAKALEQTSETMLTLYTCTPLLTAKNRLIIHAKPLPQETP